MVLLLLQFLLRISESVAGEEEAENLGRLDWVNTDIRHAFT